MTVPSLPKGHKIFPLLEKCAEKCDVSKMLLVKALKWKEIAEALKLDKKDIQDLEKVKTEPRDKIKAVFNTRFSKFPDTTWGEFISMLESSEGSSEVAEVVIRKLGEDDFYNKYK